MGKTFFISDIHLTAAHTERETAKLNRLLHFLDYCSQEAERLIIVGDLFDFWFEYRTAIPRGYTRAICALSQLDRKGVALHYISGNHDFWMRDYFSDELHLDIHPDFMEAELNGKRFYIFHGDGIAKNDRGYRILKKIFRNRVNIFLYSLLHPDLGIPLAKWVSSLSRQHTAPEGEPDDRDYLEKAKNLFSAGYDFVLCGHLHFPKLLRFGENVYVNLGDWIDHFTYAVFDEKTLTLEHWDK